MTEPTTTTAGPATKRRPGRPKGSTTKRPARPAPPTPRGSAPADPSMTPTDDRKATVSDVMSAAVPAAEKGAGRPSSIDNLARQLATSYRSLGGIIEVLGMVLPAEGGARARRLGRAIQDGADECGLALARWAETNPAVKRWLTSGSQFSALGAVLAAHAGIGAALFISTDLPGPDMTGHIVRTEGPNLPGDDPTPGVPGVAEAWLANLVNPNGAGAA